MSWLVLYHLFIKGGHYGLLFFAKFPSNRWLLATSVVCFLLNSKNAYSYFWEKELSLPTPIKFWVLSVGCWVIEEFGTQNYEIWISFKIWNLKFEFFLDFGVWFLEFKMFGVWRSQSIHFYKPVIQFYNILFLKHLSLS